MWFFMWPKGKRIQQTGEPERFDPFFVVVVDKMLYTLCMCMESDSGVNVCDYASIDA